jgi:succinylornithine aminotransferase
MMMCSSELQEVSNSPAVAAGVDRADFDALMIQTYAPSSVIPVSGRGAWVNDARGMPYLDFTSGIAVVSLGHSHPATVRALKDQADRLWHIGNGFTNEPVLQLAKALVAKTFADRVFMANSGAEANEAALKLARKYAKARGPGRTKIVACEQAFHGRTLFTVSVGGRPSTPRGSSPCPRAFSMCPSTTSEPPSARSLTMRAR